MGQCTVPAVQLWNSKDKQHHTMVNAHSDSDSEVPLNLYFNVAVGRESVHRLSSLYRTVNERSPSGTATCA